MVPLVFSVDDDATGQIILKAFLQDESFCEEFISFQCPVEALSELKARAQADYDTFPGVLFIDIRMPKMNGWELVDGIIPLIKNKDRMPAIVMLTGTATPDDHARAEANPYVLCLEEKPLTSALLLRLRGFGEIKEYFSPGIHASCV